MLATLDAESIDVIVTDPPYELGFMGKSWDKSGVAFDPATWVECLRVLKPGGHMLAFGGSRTFHRIAVAIEDAGFEIRDTLMWLYGSGFPKSLDVSKAIDRAAGVKREVTRIGQTKAPELAGKFDLATSETRERRDSSATPEAEQWDGWGTALKPAWEPIIMARKPFRGNVATNVLTHGTGAINIDACRIEGDAWSRPNRRTALGIMNDDCRQPTPMDGESHAGGRWPANLILDETAAAMLDAETSDLHSAGFHQNGNETRNGSTSMFGIGNATGSQIRHGDSGGASRFFYTAKSSTSERHAGLKANGNTHPTVKPIGLMRWLVRLISPPGGTVCDPFVGSGTTGCAIVLEPELQLSFIGIDNESAHIAIADSRIEHWRKSISIDGLPMFAGMDAA